MKNEENNDKLINSELLKSVNIIKEKKDENAFLNSINKPTNIRYKIIINIISFFI